MNEKRFIELLNLYIDGEISTEEQEELDREIAEDTRRREIYHSYSRLQTASQQAYKRLGSSLSKTVDFNKYQIVARSSTRCCLRRGLLYSTASLAAACLTVVAAIAFFQGTPLEFSSVDPSGGERLAQVEVLDPQMLNARERERRTFAFHSSEPFTFVGRPVFRSKRSEAFLESPRSAFQPEDWKNELQPGAQRPVFRGHPSFEATPELASFHFQR